MSGQQLLDLAYASAHLYSKRTGSGLAR